MKLVLIRHAEPDYERDSLTEKGFREAALLGKRVAGWKPDFIYCSPLGRARATAAPALELLGREAQILPWAREFSAPVKDPETGEERIPWDLLPGRWTEEERYYDYREWYRTPLMKSGGVEEEYRLVCEGLDRLLAEHGYVREGKCYRVEKPGADTVVIFCHLGVTLVMLSHLLGISPVLLWHGFFLAPTSVTALLTEERERGKAYFRCQAAGDTSHLLLGGEPVSGRGAFADPLQG